jgi:hypothetical protein
VLSSNYPFESPEFKLRNGESWRVPDADWRPIHPLSVVVWWFLLGRQLLVDRPWYASSCAELMMRERPHYIVNLSDFVARRRQLKFRQLFAEFLQPNESVPRHYFFAPRSALRPVSPRPLAGVPTAFATPENGGAGIRVKGLDGHWNTWFLPMTMYVEDFAEQYAQSAGVARKEVRVIYGGQPLIAELRLSENVQRITPVAPPEIKLHVIAQLRGDVGEWTKDEDRPEQALQDADYCTAVLKRLRAETCATAPRCGLDPKLLPSAARRKLRSLLRGQGVPQGVPQGDFKRSLSVDEFEALVGATCFANLQRLFGAKVTRVVLRRVTCVNHHIPFHLDTSLRTMQLPLSTNYEGAKLIFLTPTVHVPSRELHSFTIHDNTIAHGVTTLRSGVRDSLFLLSGPH